MPGSPVFHGIATTPQGPGYGGSARVETSSIAAGNVSDMNFFIWVGIIGLLIPALLIGGLQVGKFRPDWKGARDVGSVEFVFAAGVD